MDTVKRLFSAFLLLALLLSVFPLAVSAAVTEMEITQYADGWENWGGGSYGLATQLLIQLDTTTAYSPDALYSMRNTADFEIILKADSTGVSKTIHMAPSSAYLAGSWGILRFETCEGVAPNRFVPTYGETYTVTLNVYQNNSLRYTGTSDGYYCGMTPVYHGEEVVAEPEGTLYNSFGSDPQYLEDNRFFLEFYDPLAYGIQVGDGWTAIVNDRRYRATITDLPLIDGESDYAIEFQLDESCRFGHGKTYSVYLEAKSGDAAGFYIPFSFTTETVDYADIMLSPYNDGWENLNGRTQLLLYVQDTEDCLAYDLFNEKESESFTLELTGGLGKQTVSMKPSSFYRTADGGTLRFETCEATGANQFIPIVGVEYAVTLTVVTNAGTTYYGSANHFYCPVIPFVNGVATDLRDQVIAITWVVDKTRTVSYYAPGTLPVYDGTPIKADDPGYSYIFDCWDKTVTPATEKTTYVAKFRKIPRDYEISFTVGEKTYTQSCAYGEIPVFSGSTDYTDPTGAYLYTFTGWSPALHPTIGNESYTATYQVTELGTLCLSISDTAATVGNTVTVPILLNGNTDGIHGFAFTVEYDSSYLIFKDCSILPQGYSYYNPHTAGQINLGWTALTPYTENGTVAALTFTVAKNAPQALPITIHLQETDGFFRLTDAGETPIYCTTIDGTLLVSGQAIKGDINEDGIVSIMDVTALLNYLANNPSISLSLVDISGDNIFSIQDVTALLLLLAKQA